MLFFRSEEMVQEWCREKGFSMQPLVTIAQLWEMASTWYSTRLQADSHRPQPDEIRKIFAGIGLQGDFWDPSSDSFA